MVEIISEQNPLSIKETGEVVEGEVLEVINKIKEDSLSKKELHEMLEILKSYANNRASSNPIPLGTIITNAIEQEDKEELKKCRIDLEILITLVDLCLDPNRSPPKTSKDNPPISLFFNFPFILFARASL